mmetsp:Transcript_161732/g.514078  ORF Transcript_161732/g.514078 Transcript_161732/m.514078 type:complete len:297 (+) Transcript_161732:73-963(+)
MGTIRRFLHEARPAEPTYCNHLVQEMAKAAANGECRSLPKTSAKASGDCDPGNMPSSGTITSANSSAPRKAWFPPRRIRPKPASNSLPSLRCASPNNATRPESSSPPGASKKRLTTDCKPSAATTMSNGPTSPPSPSSTMSRPVPSPASDKPTQARSICRVPGRSEAAIIASKSSRKAQPMEWSCSRSSGGFWIDSQASQSPSRRMASPVARSRSKVRREAFSITWRSKMLTSTAGLRACKARARPNPARPAPMMHTERASSSLSPHRPGVVLAATVVRTGLRLRAIVRISEKTIS